MSFGRADFGPNGSHPLSFWQEQAKRAENEKNKQKKFSYKNRQQKFSIRNHKRDALEKNESKKQNNKVKKSTENAAATKNIHQVKKIEKTSNKPSDDKVTLTKKQLDSLLETVAELTLKTEEKENLQTKDLGLDMNGDIEKNSLVSDNMPSINTYHVTHRVDSSPDSGIEAHLEDATRISINPSEVPGLSSYREPPKQQAPLNRVTYKQDSTNVISKPPVPHTLTKMEQKRLQWEKERAEQDQDYSPWGRPGAGAPVKDDHGNILADFNSRRDYLIQKSFDPPTGGSTVSALPIPKSTKNIVQNEEASISSATGLQQSHDLSTARELNQPAAIRSSFAIGAGAPDADMFTSIKERKRQEWLKELDQQKLEKQQEKQKAKEAERGAGLHDQWADCMTNYQPQAHVRQQVTQNTQPQQSIHTNRSIEAQNLNTTQRLSESQYMPTNTNQTSSRLDASQDWDNSQGSTFLRGQNMFVDPQTLKEMDAKRKKEKEHQEAIRAQVEQKEALKRQERERQLREDAIAEEKMKAEQDRIAKEYKEEQEKQKQKRNDETLRVQRLKEAFDKAQEEADRLKHEQRMKRLQKGGHDTARLNHQFNVDGMSVQSGVGPSSVSHESRSQPVVEPSYVAGLNLGSLSRRDVVEPDYVPGLTDRVIHDTEEGYTSNRVLTPSTYRTLPAEPLSPRREYGTQTDMELVNSLISDKKTKRPQKNQSRMQERRVTERRVTERPVTESRVTERPPVKQPEKRVRVLSAPEHEKHKRPIRLHERPRWGAGGKPNKKLVKNSEKDPHYERRRRMIEEQREKRQQELLEESNRYSAHIPRGRSRYVRSSTSDQRSRSQDARSRGQDGRSRGQDARSRSQDARSRAVAALNDPSQEPVSILRQKNRSASPTNAYYPHTTPSPQNRQQFTPTLASQVSPGRGQSLRHDNYTTSQAVAQDIYASDYILNVPPSPPVPSLRHGRTSNQSYGSGVSAPPHTDGQYLGIIRSDQILDPSHADDPMPPSREATNIERGRKAYIRGHEPGSYGAHMEDHIDPMNTLDNQRNPILNPSMVTDHPTARQGRILQQLSDLRKGLIQKQKELEVGLLVTAE